MPFIRVKERIRIKKTSRYVYFSRFRIAVIIVAISFIIGKTAVVITNMMTTPQKKTGISSVLASGIAGKSKAEIASSLDSDTKEMLKSQLSGLDEESKEALKEQIKAMAGN